MPELMEMKKRKFNHNRKPLEKRGGEKTYNYKKKEYRKHRGERRDKLKNNLQAAIKKINEINDTYNIVDVVSRHVELKKSGGDNHIGLCPFHNEKTPSFVVDEGKQKYKCFGCGESGDTYDFLKAFGGDLSEIRSTDVSERKLRSEADRLKYQMGSVSERNKLYKNMKQIFPLSKEDADILLMKGVKSLDDYFTIPRPLNKQKCFPISDEFKGKVPGKYFDKYLQTRAINGYFYGIACAMKDYDGNYTGIEIWLSDECKKEIIDSYGGKEEAAGFKLTDSVYRPLNSNKKHGGASLTEFAFVVGDITDGTDVIITEGMRKARIIHEQTGIPVISVRGVSNWSKQFMFFLEGLRRNPKIGKVIIAYDMDKSNKSGRHKTVKKAYEKLLEELIDLKSVEVETWEWDDTQIGIDGKKCKGLDDALLAGLEIKKIQHKNEVYMGLNEARNILLETIAKIIKENNGKFNLKCVTAGVGKTHSSIMALNYLFKHGWPKIGKRKAKILFVMDNKKLINEHLHLFDMPIMPLEGRSDDPDSSFYCYEYEDVARIAAAGKNTFKMACSDCVVKDTCPYLNNTRKIMNGNLVVANKAAIFNNSNRAENFDIIIIDESVEDIFKLEKSYNLQDIKNNIAVFESIIKNLENMNEERLMDYFRGKLDVFNSDLDFFRKQEVDLRKEHLEQYYDLLKLMGESREEAKQVKFTMYPNINYPDKYEFYNKPDLDVKGIKVGKKVIVYPKSIFDGFKSPDFYIETDGTLTTRDVNQKTIDSLKGKTVINLDATPSSFVKLMGEENIVDHNYSVKQHVKVLEIRDAQYNKRQMRMERYQQRVIDGIRFYINLYGKNHVGIMSTKEVHYNLLQKLDFINHDLCGYHGRDSKGTNRMKNVKVWIQIGPYIKNLGAVQRDVDLLNRNGVDVSFEDHCDEITYAETVQSFARPRGVQRTEDNEVIIIKFTNRKIKGIVSDEIYDNVYDLINGENVTQKNKRKLDEKLQEFHEKNRDRKMACNAMIAENEPPYEKCTKNIEHPKEGGSEIKQPLNYSDIRGKIDLGFLRSQAEQVKNVSNKLWFRFLEVLEMGFETIGQIKEKLNVSESTAKRLRGWLKNLIQMRENGQLDAPETQEQAIEMGIDAVELSVYAINEYFDVLLADHEEKHEMTRDYGSFFKFYRKHCASIRQNSEHGTDRKLKEALATIRDYPDHENSFDWFWMCYFEAHAGTLAKTLLKDYPWMVIEWLMVKTESETTNV